MKSLIGFLSCGNVSKDKKVYRFRVTKFLDLTNKIIPLFKKYPILGEKSKDFEDFCKVVEIIKTKKHLGTPPAPSPFIFSPFRIPLFPFPLSISFPLPRQRKGEREEFGKGKRSTEERAKGVFGKCSLFFFINYLFS